MKHTLNIIGWAGLLLTFLFICGTSSCKKEDNVTIPSTINNTINTYSEQVYARVNIAQATEADTLWIINNNGTLYITPVVTCAQPDTIKAPSFSHNMRYYPILLQGGYTVNGDTLRLSYTEYNTINNTFVHSGVTNAKYKRIT